MKMWYNDGVPLHFLEKLAQLHKIRSNFLKMFIFALNFV